MGEWRCSFCGYGRARRRCVDPGRGGWEAGYDVTPIAARVPGARALQTRSASASSVRQAGHWPGCGCLGRARRCRRRLSLFRRRQRTESPARLARAAAVPPKAMVEVSVEVSAPHCHAEERRPYSCLPYPPTPSPSWRRRTQKRSSWERPRHRTHPEDRAARGPPPSSKRPPSPRTSAALDDRLRARGLLPRPAQRKKDEERKQGASAWSVAKKAHAAVRGGARKVAKIEIENTGWRCHHELAPCISYESQRRRPARGRIHSRPGAASGFLRSRRPSPRSSGWALLAALRRRGQD